MIKRLLFALAPVALFSSPACAGNWVADALSAINETTPAGLVGKDSRQPGLKGWFASQAEGYKQLVRNGTTGLVIPAYTEHPRWEYSDRDEENAYPWGAGMVRSIIDERGNERLAYLLLFSDSHYKPEPFLGYGWMARWGLGQTGLHVGAGYIAGLTFRADYHWLPIPAPLPLLGVGTQRFGAYMTYIPFTNVAFFFTRIDLEGKDSREMPLTPASPWYDRNNLLYAGASWVHTDLGGPDLMTMKSDGGWTLGYRRYLDRHWAADIGLITSRHNTYWRGDKRYRWTMSQVHLLGQYHAQAADSLRVFAGGGLGYTRLHRSGRTRQSVHPVVQFGFTWAATRGLHLTGSVTTSFGRFKRLDPDVSDGTARPAPGTFSLSIGKSF